MQLSRLQLAGFKTFVEPVDLPILPGLTGIVGPNGCGKSNLVEAIRWVMGEQSARRLRGGEMDDVIFAGSRKRPARSLANVTLVFDNSKHQAPLEWNDAEQIEISRTIERAAGSRYHVNGREVRARDVQTLFADLSTGSQASAMVRQGQISALIQAKPTERRMILEEAAGVRGLNARRHEAEQKLNTAATNLSRLMDILKSHHGQAGQLQRQANAAQQFRKLSRQLRSLERLLVARRLAEIDAQSELQQQQLQTCHEEARQQDQQMAEASTQLANRAAELLTLQHHHQTHLTAKQRLTTTLQFLQQQLQQAEQQLQQAKTSEQQLARDIEREQQLLQQAQQQQSQWQQQLQQLQQELAELPSMLADQDDDQLKQLVATLNTHTEQTRTLQQQLWQKQSQLQEVTRAEQELSKQLQSTTAQLQQLQQQSLPALDQLEQQREQLSVQLKTDDEHIEQLSKQQSLLTEQLPNLQQQESVLYQQWRQAQQHVESLQAESKALHQLIQQLTDGGLNVEHSLIGQLHVPSDVQQALSAVLGQDLQAATQADAPRWWRLIESQEVLPSLPDGAIPLSRHIDAPRVVQRSLSMIGLVESNADGMALQSQLKAGQALVSRDGQVWRWDGYVSTKPEVSAAAQWLKHRTRLAEVDAELKTRLPSIETLKTEHQQAQHNTQQVQQQLQQVQRLRAERTSQLDRAKQQYHHLMQTLHSATEKNMKHQQQVEQLQQRFNEQSQQMAQLSDQSQLSADVQQAQQAFAVAQESLADINRRHARYVADRQYQQQQRDERQRRIQQLMVDVQNVQQQQQTTHQRLAQLNERRQEVESQLSNLLQQPQQLYAEQQSLLSELSTCDADLQHAQQQLASVQQAQQLAQSQLQHAQSRRQKLAEDEVRLRTELSNAEQLKAHILQTASEMEANSGETEVIDASDDDESWATTATDELRALQQKLQHKRQTIGPVNLVAEQELTNLRTIIDGMEKERDELQQAIDKLQQAIGALNREGRERMRNVFTQVDENFRELFVKLFSGGEAQLTWVGGDDPLQAGLEIMVRPPGKKLQTLSLLSGGEQALTTLALIFAVYLIQPSPICILDEVDAPLDDANVERFCQLLDDMAQRAPSSFLVVTHHRVTMARMHRLYGVTMPEEGVSQLVSVSLDHSPQLKLSA